MSTERFSLNFDIDHSGSLILVYGNVIQEEFLFSDLKYRNIENALWKFCKENSFDRVILYDTINRIHFFDEKSKNLFIDFETPIKKKEANPFNETDDVFGSSPLQHIDKEDTVESKVVNTKETSNHNGIFHINVLTDSDAISQLDNCMKETSIKTAIIFSKYDLRFIDEQGRGTLINTIQEWSNLSHSNNNKCFFIVNSHKLEDLKENINNTPILNTIIEQYKENKGMQSIMNISHPKKDEIKRLIQATRLKRDIEIEWNQIDAITRSIMGAMRPLKHWASHLNSNKFDIINLHNMKKIIGGKIADFSTETALQRLLNMIGLENVKKQVLKQVRLVRAAKKNPSLIENSRMHLSFKGNPGTGKTTVARLISEIYQEEGILTNGHLIEGDRQNLVAGFVGQTAIKTNEMCNDAMGGVLFIDEAYSLKKESKNSDDTFGQEAIDTLIKKMEDSKDDLCVILAGYPKEMDVLMEANPGFKDRIGAEIIFEDYNAKQLFQIAQLIIKNKKIIFSANILNDINTILENAYKNRDNKFGNARYVENLIKDIIDEHIQISAEKEIDFNLLTVDSVSIPLKYKDLLITETIDDSIEKSLESLNKKVGLQKVKTFVNDMIDEISAEKEKIKRGFVKNKASSRHMIFSGNPGTGKTTVARDFGKIFKALGVLKKGHVIEVQGEDLVAGYVGQTSSKAEDMINSALDGVLFIDEAYGLISDSKSSGFFNTAQNKLLKLMEDNKDRLIVIAAGYPDEMERFLSSNVGFRSRFANNIIFENYNADELTQIVKNVCEESEYILKPKSISRIEDFFTESIVKSNKREFGNAREAINFFEIIKRNQNKRILQDLNISNIDFMTVIEDDIPLIKKGIDISVEEAIVSLNDKIGLKSVKSFVDSMIINIKLEQSRIEKGLITAKNTPSRHMIFSGNPGTGKTTVARDFGKIFKALGILKKGHVIEVQGEDLVAGYVGQTSSKAEEVINSALDGVLFIDEAYGLISDGKSSGFFATAQNKLLKLMEDNKDRLIVIAAGYPDEMERFLSSNIGFKSRFANNIIFENYNTDELTEIVLSVSTKSNFKIDNIALDKIKDTFDIMIENTNLREFGNARTAINFFEKIKSRQNIRITKLIDLSDDDYMNIIIDDIPNIN